jgi:hypothetical protein
LYQQELHNCQGQTGQIISDRLSRVDGELSIMNRLEVLVVPLKAKLNNAVTSSKLPRPGLTAIKIEVIKLISRKRRGVVRDLFGQTPQ